MRRNRIKRAGTTLVAALLAVALAGGCGGSDDETSAGKGESAKQDGGKKAGQPEPTPNPLGPPPDKEDLVDAQERIAAALASGDCAEINALNPISRPNLDTEERCKYLKRLDGLSVAGLASYGDLAGEIDYAQGKRILNAVMIRDADGLFHIAYIDKFANAKGVDTEFAEQEFTDAANDAVKALAEGDCEAYQKVAFVEFGRGSRPSDELCPRVEQNPVASRLERAPDAKPKPIGGNAVFGFYELDTPKTFFTLVLRRQSSSDRLPKGEELPEDAAEYSYVDAYRTNEREPPTDSGG